MLEIYTGTSSSSSVSRALCDILQDHSLEQLVKTPTRNQNILDLFLTNQTEIIQDLEVVDGLSGSDHDAISFTVESSRPRYTPSKRLVYKFKKADFDAYQNLLSKVPWDCIHMDESVDDNWTKLKNVIIATANDCIPHTTLKLKRTKNWLSDKTLSAIKKKRRLYRRAKRSGKPNDLNRYRAFSNTVHKLTRRDHHSHVDHISTC